MNKVFKYCITLNKTIYTLWIDWGFLKYDIFGFKKRKNTIKKRLLTFYHGTNEHGLETTKKQGYLLHERKSEIMPNASPCTYLALDVEEAKQYGNIILKVKYNPFKNPQMNNYCKGCWQVRVYEPIYNYEKI